MPPNVVLIVADDLGRECLASYGGESWETPVLDSFAASGMRFSHCYATPWCFPSRVELLTGKYGFRNTGAWGEFDVDRGTTFAQLLRRAGYATCVAGKWQLCRFDDPVNADHPWRAGFDEHCVWIGELRDATGERRYTPKYWGPWVWQNGKRREDPAQRYGEDVFREYLIGFLERSRFRPFFAFYPMLLPHLPYQPTPYSGPLARAIGALPTRLQRQFDSRYFADYLTYLDRCVGGVLAALDGLGLRDRTLVLFTSDNGTDPAISSSMNGRTVRGGKSLMTDVGTRVPLLASLPGVVPAGSTCGDLVDLSDFLPTFAELAGAPLPTGEIFDGRSFWPQLQGEPGRPREWVYFQSIQTGFDRAVCTQEWKLLQSGRLYHLTEDPWEERPIVPDGDSAESARVRARLQAVLDSLAISAPESAKGGRAAR